MNEITITYSVIYFLFSIYSTIKIHQMHMNKKSARKRVNRSDIRVEHTRIVLMKIVANGTGFLTCELD